MVEWMSTATRMGITLDDLNELLRGRANANLANRLGITMADVEDFIRGNVSFGMAGRLGLAPPAAAEELAGEAGREGRIGILLGFMLNA